MERTPTFQGGWLDIRYSFDVAARNQTVESAFVNLFKEKASLVCVDVGAGIGANCRYFMTKYPRSQTWILVEKDPLLSSKSRSYLSFHGKNLGFQVEEVGTDILLTKDQLEVRIRFLCGDLLKLAEKIDLSLIDCISANAVFDLFSKKEFERFINQASHQSIAFLSTLNYTGMRFWPNHPDNETIVNWYEAHMDQHHVSGARMGKQAPAHMLEILSQHSFQSKSGTSTWKIEENDQSMKSALLGFMREAIPELPLSDQDRQFLRNWLGQKEISNYEIEVYHEDIFAWQ